MGLAPSFTLTVEKIAGLDADERARLTTICRDIHSAQKRLNQAAAPVLAGCLSKCQGLCCRNLRPADIITAWDLIYILTLAPQMQPTIAACVASESFYPSDCIFLENGCGPCLFPENVRPERCVVSFCRLEPMLERDIRRVRGQFNRLVRFFFFRFLRRLPQRFSSSAGRRSSKP